MKKKNLFITAALSVLLGLGMAAGIGSISNKKSNVKVEAASTMVSGSRLFVQDESGKDWTNHGAGRDAIMHIYNLSFVSGSGYTSLSDVKLNDLYAVSFATDGSTYMNIRMHWCESGAGERFEAILPWYISGFTTELYCSKAGEGDRYVFYKNSDGGKGNKLSATLSRGDNLSIYMFNTSDWRGSCYWSGSDFVAITDFPPRGTGYTYEFNGIKSGSHMYLSTEDLTGWEADGAQIGICFGKSNINQGQAWSSQYNSDHTALVQEFCWKVQGSGDSHLYECIVPKYNGQDVYWSMVIGVRFNSSASSLGWSNVIDQTGDQFYNGDDRDCNMLWVNAATGGSWSGGGYLRNDKSISDSTRAGYYGTYFLDEITCDGDGSITSTSTNWTHVKLEYKQHLSTAVENIVKATSAEASGTDLVKAMYKYDYIVFYKQYSGYDDFISRSSSAGRAFANSNINLLGINSSQTTSAVLIIAVSVIAVATIGGYFFLKKKKSN